MSENRDFAKAPWHLWVVGIISLLWNSMGGVDYTMTKTRNAEWLKGFTPEQIAWFDSLPLWANLAWALGVWGAVAGSILLILRKGWAYPAFAVSFLGLAMSTVNQFVLADMPEGLDTPGGRAFTAFLWVVAIALVAYARQMRAKAVLR